MEKEIESKTLVLWFLSILVIIQITVYLTLKLSVDKNYQESSDKEAEVRKQVMETIEKEEGNAK